MLRGLMRRRVAPLGDYFGVLARGRRSFHAHCILAVPGRLDPSGLRPTPAVESTTVNALRGRDEVQIKRGTVFVQRSAFCSPDAWSVISSATVGHLEYAATQRVPHLPPRMKPFFQSKPPASVSGLPFAAFRTEWVDNLSTAELPEHVLNVASRCASWRVEREHALRIENRTRSNLGLPSLPREIVRRTEGVAAPPPRVYPPRPSPAMTDPPEPPPRAPVDPDTDRPADSVTGRTDPRCDLRTWWCHGLDRPAPAPPLGVIAARYAPTHHETRLLRLLPGYA